MKGKILVTIQFGCLFLLAITTHWLAMVWWVFLLLAISAALAFWAMASMKLGNFNVVPTPVANGVMVSRGPYKVIRHPMYSSILIFALAIVSGEFSYVKLIISLVLLAGLVVKMLYEEELLCRQYPDYKGYMDKTKRMVPFVW